MGQLGIPTPGRRGHAVEPGEFFLRRLERLVTLDGTSQPDVDAETLIRWATYSTYADCLNLGLREEARRVLDRRARPTR